MAYVAISEASEMFMHQQVEWEWYNDAIVNWIGWLRLNKSHHCGSYISSDITCPLDVPRCFYTRISLLHLSWKDLITISAPEPYYPH